MHDGRAHIDIELAGSLRVCKAEIERVEETVLEGRSHALFLGEHEIAG